MAEDNDGKRRVRVGQDGILIAVGAVLRHEPLPDPNADVGCCVAGGGIRKAVDRVVASMAIHIIIWLTVTIAKNMAVRKRCRRTKYCFTRRKPIIFFATSCRR
jgi:hypothetical protein